jgi:hypothetical protein
MKWKDRNLPMESTQVAMCLLSMIALTSKMTLIEFGFLAIDYIALMKKMILILFTEVLKRLLKIRN